MQHIPVALERCIALLAPAIERCETPIIIDATLGLGGHSKVLLERYPQLRIIGFDRDLSAIALAKENLKDFIGRVTIVHAIYDEITNV